MSIKFICSFPSRCGETLAAGLDGFGSICLIVEAIRAEGRMIKRVLVTIGVFILGAIVGYAGILFGWIAVTEIADIFDREGAMIMGVAFFYAPVGGLVLGVVAAVVGQRWLQK